MKTTILHLPIKLYWLKKIINKTKKWEYRDIKPYYTTRLFDFHSYVKKDSPLREYEEIWLRAGYQPGDPLVKIKWNSWKFRKYKGHDCYAFDVTEILSIENYTAKRKNIPGIVLQFLKDKKRVVTRNLICRETDLGPGQVSRALTILRKKRTVIIAYRSFQRPKTTYNIYWGAT